MTVETLRYYEEVRLLQRRERTAGGYRIFMQEDLDRIDFIQRAKRLGLSLGEIRDILAIQAADQATCSHVRDLLEGKIAEVDAAIEGLTDFRAHLSQLLERSQVSKTAVRRAAGCAASSKGRRSRNGRRRSTN